MDAEQMTSGRRRWMGIGGALALTLMLGASASTVRGQAGWPFHIEWNHDGIGVSYYRLCVNGQCAVVQATRRGPAWRAPLPLLPQGEHRIVVEACNRDACLTGTPDLMIRVVPPSRRRPPIEVVDGPRIELGNRE
jgi:hypothetical protein